jgi:hypothetical protein
MRELSEMEKRGSYDVLSSYEFSLRETFYPYGFPLELETNSAEVMAAAAGGWGAFAKAFDAQPVRMCLGVAGHSRDPLPLESVIRARENLMTVVADENNFVTCDFNARFAFGWVTHSTAADHPLLRYRFLIAGGATLVEQHAFTPLHGALVSRSASGIMLAGDSFAGKSTLAYACARTGWTYVSDDATYLVLERSDCYAVGDPHSIRFRPDAPSLFPELAGHVPSVRPNGKAAIEVRTRDLGLQTAAGCAVDHVVYLHRQAGRRQAVLSPISPRRALEDWSKYNVLGTVRMREARRGSYARLLSARLWEMRYSELDDAVERLNRLVDLGA